MEQLETIPPPAPLDSHDIYGEEVIQHLLDNIGPDEVDPYADSGYFEFGDVVLLQRSDGSMDEGWIFVGVSKSNPDEGVFVKMIDGHRARKHYPFNWDLI